MALTIKRKYDLHNRFALLTMACRCFWNRSDIKWTAWHRTGPISWKAFSKRPKIQMRAHRNPVPIRCRQGPFWWMQKRRRRRRRHYHAPTDKDHRPPQRLHHRLVVRRPRVCIIGTHLSLSSWAGFSLRTQPSLTISFLLGLCDVAPLDVCNFVHRPTVYCRHFFFSVG